MKTQCIIILIVLLPVFVFGQINSSIDFAGGIEYSYRNLTTSIKDGPGREFYENRIATESGKFNWRMGFNYNKRISEQWMLKIGLRFASVGYKEEKMTGFKWPSEFDATGVWTPNPKFPHEFQYVHDFWFAEIPVIGRFEFNDKKLTPFVEFGMSPSIFLKTRTKVITDVKTDFEESQLRDLSKLHLVGVFSFGVNYSVNEKIQLFGQPTFRYHFTKVAESDIRDYLFNYGLELGIRRKIN